MVSAFKVNGRCLPIRLRKVTWPDWRQQDDLFPDSRNLMLGFWQAICCYGWFNLGVARLLASHMITCVVQALCCQDAGKPYANVGGLTCVLPCFC